jgi:2-amino-4-hydroxy-6-hydroxymethyldihydropteridine diphosphokinase
MIKVFLSFGSNVGNRIGQIQEAIDYFNYHPQIDRVRQSSYYETEPLYYKDQAWFINCVIELYTSLSASQLLDCCQFLERLFKKNKQVHNGPRTLDIDILTYGSQTIDAEDLKIPHPCMFERKFVLVPLLELATELNAIEYVQKMNFNSCSEAVKLYACPYQTSNHNHAIP